ncbi:MAG: GNAT family N-acetyltransferase [Clostridia bacterium]|nr:GNAT family N-acetyltransferase [Clostridia bacterium]
MIRFENVNEETFSAVYEKMCAAFPLEERREFTDQSECMTDKRFRFLEIYENADPVGFIALWVLCGFVFIEHLAIDEDKRAGGYGTRAIELVKELYNVPLILEAEAPETEQQIKRIRFYERLGFKVNSYPYEQPSYHGGDGVPLLVLSYPVLLNCEEFENFIAETRNSAYKKKGDT